MSSLQIRDLCEASLINGFIPPGACPRVTTLWGSKGALSTSWSRAGPIPCPRSGFVYYVLMIKRFTIIFTEMGIKTSDIDKKIDKHPSYN